MTATTRVSVTADEWTALSDGDANVLVQLVSLEVVEICVAATAPGAAQGVGHPLTPSDPAISFANLVTGDKVYARAHNGAPTLAVTK